MYTIIDRIQYFTRFQRLVIRGKLIHLHSLVHPTWHYIQCPCICTNGHVVKIGKNYTYVEGSILERVRLVDVLEERKYLYCSLYFLDHEKLKTIRHIKNRNATPQWKLLDEGVYSEIKSQRLWKEIIIKNKSGGF